LGGLEKLNFKFEMLKVNYCLAREWRRGHSLGKGLAPANGWESNNENKRYGK